MKNITIILFFLSVGLQGQVNDEVVLHNMFENAIQNKDAIDNLEFLCKQAPGRMIGTKESEIAVEYFYNYLNALDLDTVFLQEFSSPAWICDSASLFVLIGKEWISLKVDALGPSLATPEGGVTAEVIEVKSLTELDSLGKAVKDKFVFFNRPMKPTFVNTFQAYGDAVDQRYWGPSKAAEYGAAGVIVRSMTPNFDDFPHTGSFNSDSLRAISVAVSTNDAERMSSLLQKSPDTKVNIYVDAKDIQVKTHNLIADIRGKEKPDEIILIGGHIDAWHNTQGAHDDGTGCAQTVDVLRLFKEIGINNKHTIRTVLFMDEELYQSGGNAYADFTEKNNLNHIIAIESDAGGLTPEGFSFDAPPDFVEKVARFQPLLRPYGIYYISEGFGGVDIAPLKQFGVKTGGYRTDCQRYYDFHHCANDSFEKVNFRELQLGTVCIAGIIYLIDKYGLN